MIKNNLFIKKLKNVKNVKNYQKNKCKLDNDSDDSDNLEENGDMSDNINIYIDKNHIYFYTNVSIKSCLILNIKINELNKKLLKYSIDYDNKPPNIYLHINSNGGDLLSSFSVIDTIINSNIPIISIIEGSAASAATLIAMVCKERYITENSFMLIHQLSSGIIGKYEDIKYEYINDAKLMKLLYNLYIKYTKMTLNKLKILLKKDIWLTSNECILYGLVDNIYKNI
jgi:ATP-dependent protease ClpP protease subunit